MLGAALALPFASGCSEPNQTEVNLPNQAAMSTSEEALKRRFRGIRGGELRVDSMFETAKCLIIVVETGYQFNISSESFGPKGASVSGYGGNWPGDRLPMPKHLQLLRFPEDAKFVSRDKPPYYEGSPLVDVTVPVAERIPDEVLDNVRNKGGNLRLKLRIHPKTLLVGWDIERVPGYDPKKTEDARGIHIYYPSEYSFIGGDFCERQIWYVKTNGRIERVVKKGWYIDPDTGQRVETDY